jgi:RES domain-containing protein
VRAQHLDRVLTCYRIGDPAGTWPIFDATGSTLYPGRWNDVGVPVIYSAAHYSTAMLEKLAHGTDGMPPNQHYITITVPNGLTYELVGRDHLPGWDTPEPTASRAHGAAWAAERRSLLLLVPSYVARVERNVVLNPAHPEFPRVSASLHEPVWWDERLF